MARRRLHRVPRDRSVECELKFRLSGPRDHKRLRDVLRKLGAQLEGTYDEENFRFQGPGKTTRNTTLRLRVFDGGPRGVLTAKGPVKFIGGVKVREETEVEVSDSHATLDLLGQLGFLVVVTYRKRRASWKYSESTVTLDTLDYGHFVEVEGPLEAIPAVARTLGLDPATAVKDSYSVLARQHLSAQKKASKKTSAGAQQPTRPRSS